MRRACGMNREKRYIYLTCRMVRVTNKRTSTSVDWIYYHFSYTRTLNYT
jgi:hypothetical protein